MIRAVTLTVATLLTLSLVPCLACSASMRTTPRSRVAKDLGCTTEETGVRELGPIPGEKAARWEVSGCGRTAIYVCTTPVRDCWREVAPPQAAPVPPVSPAATAPAPPTP